MIWREVRKVPEKNDRYATVHFIITNAKGLKENLVPVRHTGITGCLVVYREHSAKVVELEQVPGVVVVAFEHSKIKSSPIQLWLSQQKALAKRSVIVSGNVVAFPDKLF